MKDSLELLLPKGIYKSVAHLLIHCGGDDGFVGFGLGHFNMSRVFLTNAVMSFLISGEVVASCAIWPNVAHLVGT